MINLRGANPPPPLIKFFSKLGGGGVDSCSTPTQNSRGVATPQPPCLAPLVCSIRGVPRLARAPLEIW